MFDRFEEGHGIISKLESTGAASVINMSSTRLPVWE